MVSIAELLGLVALPKYDQLRKKQGAAAINSDVDLQRRNTADIPGLQGLDTRTLAQLDRLSQGEVFGRNFQILPPDAPGAAPVNIAGALTALPVSLGIGGINELSKAIPGGQAVAGEIAKMIGGEPTQFNVTAASSRPSLGNLLGLVTGTWRGATE